MTYDNDKDPDLYERIGLHDPSWTEPTGKEAGLDPLVMREIEPPENEPTVDPWPQLEGPSGPGIFD
jgi:hypothetical protein